MCFRGVSRLLLQWSNQTHVPSGDTKTLMGFPDFSMRRKQSPRPLAEPLSCRTQRVAQPVPTPLVLFLPCFGCVPNILQTAPIQLPGCRIRRQRPQRLCVDSEFNWWIRRQSLSMRIFPLNIHLCAFPVCPRDLLIQRLLSLCTRGCPLSGE